jgi:5-formyltetrahydrofolate cyclo-ligase
MNNENPANTHHENTENNAVALRAGLRLARTRLSDDVCARGSLLMRGRLFTWLAMARDAAAQAGAAGPTKVAAFWPLAGEPDLRPLLTQWTEAGVVVALPAARTPAAPLTFLRWTPETPMAAGLHGVAEPQTDEWVIPDLVLVPTLGYSARADRLGYGAGYYDRTLAAFEAAGHVPVTIGIAWAEGRLPADYVPAPHDHRLNAILTPAGWVPAAPPFSL